MFERFSRSTRVVIEHAQKLAVADGADTVEAEHLLLALTQVADEPTARGLATLGMTEPTVRAALDEEFTQALATVGVAATVPPRRPSRQGRTNPKWGQSAKLVLVRSLQVAIDRGHKPIDDRHLLIAISQAEAGVIPHVLQTLHVSASDLEAALR
jgi:ATP-dependent Clp protease ATP-binding subunit ClpA